MVNMLATGATNLIFALAEAKRATTVHRPSVRCSRRAPSDIPVVGTVLFSQPFSTWVAFPAALCGRVHYV